MTRSVESKFMTTLAKHDFHSDLQQDGTIPVALRSYFAQRLLNRVHQELLTLIRRMEANDSEFSKRKLAKRLDKKPEQLSRWLSYPSNMTLETVSDLFIGMCCELELTVKFISSEPKEQFAKNYENVIIGEFEILTKKITEGAFNRNNLRLDNSINKKTLITRKEGLSYA